MPIYHVYTYSFHDVGRPSTWVRFKRVALTTDDPNEALRFAGSVPIDPVSCDRAVEIVEQPERRAREYRRRRTNIKKD